MCIRVSPKNGLTTRWKRCGVQVKNSRFEIIQTRIGRPNVPIIKLFTLKLWYLIFRIGSIYYKFELLNYYTHTHKFTLPLDVNFGTYFAVPQMI